VCGFHEKSEKDKGLFKNQEPCRNKGKTPLTFFWQKKKTSSGQEVCCEAVPGDSEKLGVNARKNGRMKSLPAGWGGSQPVSYVSTPVNQEARRGVGGRERVSMGEGSRDGFKTDTERR